MSNTSDTYNRTLANPIGSDLPQLTSNDDSIGPIAFNRPSF